MRKWCSLDAIEHIRAHRNCGIEVDNKTLKAFGDLAAKYGKEDMLE